MWLTCKTGFPEQTVQRLCELENVGIEARGVDSRFTTHVNVSVTEWRNKETQHRWRDHTYQCIK